MKQKLLRLFCVVFTAILLISAQGCAGAPHSSPGETNAPTQTIENPLPTQEAFEPFKLYQPFGNYAGMYILDKLSDPNYAYINSCLNNGRLLLLRMNMQTDVISALLMDV